MDGHKCGTNTFSPILELSNGTFIRKTTVLWLFQEGERVSSDRLFRVRGKQPFSNDTKICSLETPALNGEVPYITETVEVGDMCVFNKDDGWKIGRILQFSYHEKKTNSAYQYKGRVASTQSQDLGVLCTWFQTSTGKYRMCRSNHHSYLPLSRYVCTRNGYARTVIHIQNKTRLLYIVVVNIHFDSTCIAEIFHVNI